MNSARVFAASVLSMGLALQPFSASSAWAGGCADAYTVAIANATEVRPDAPSVGGTVVRTLIAATAPVAFATTASDGRRKGMNISSVVSASVVGGVFAAVGAAAEAFGSEGEHNGVKLGLMGLGIGAATGAAVGRGSAGYASGAAFEDRGMNRALLGTAALLSAAVVTHAVVRNTQADHAGSPSKAAYRRAMMDTRDVLQIASVGDLGGVSVLTSSQYEVLDRLITASKSGCSVENVAQFISRSGRVCVGEDNKTRLLTVQQLTQLVGTEAKAGRIADCKS